jgi:hypothetical protein
LCNCPPISSDAEGFDGLDSEFDADGEDGDDALANNRAFCAEHIGGHQANVVLKDNDLTERLRLPPEQANQLYEQICADSELLRTLGIMDYSLLLGVSCVEYLIGENQHAQHGHGAQHGQQGAQHGQHGAQHGQGERHYFSRYLAERVVGPASYSMGMVDILQTWSVQKRLERFGKVHILKEDGDGLSAMDPHRYCMRFQHKMKDILGLRGTAGGDAYSYASQRSNNASEDAEKSRHRRRRRQMDADRSSLFAGGQQSNTVINRTASGQLGVL